MAQIWLWLSKAKSVPAVGAAEKFNLASNAQYLALISVGGM